MDIDSDIEYYRQPRIDKVAYNPWAIELAMHTRGMSQAQLAKKSGISAAKLKLLIDGEIECNKEQINKLGEVLNYPENFFKQWFESKLEFTDCQCMIKTVKIDYSKYRILKVEENTPKQISFIPNYSNAKSCIEDTPGR